MFFNQQRDSFFADCTQDLFQQLWVLVTSFAPIKDMIIVAYCVFPCPRRKLEFFVRWKGAVAPAVPKNLNKLSLANDVHKCAFLPISLLRQSSLPKSIVIVKWCEKLDFPDAPNVPFTPARSHIDPPFTSTKAQKSTKNLGLSLAPSSKQEFRYFRLFTCCETLGSSGLLIKVAFY